MSHIESLNMNSVPVSTIDGEHHFTPDMLIYTAHAPDWATFPSAVPRFDILPPEYG